MSYFRGTAQLIRLAVRRDRFVLPTWIVLLGSVTCFYYVQFVQLYPSAAEREALVVATKANPAWVALAGPLTSSETGALAVWKNSVSVLVLALAAILTVIRHGRADEEFGRRELLESTPIGRLAHPTASIAVGVTASIATGLVDAVTLIAVGAPINGSVLAGAALALVGVVFALVAAAVGEVTQSARTARLVAGGVLAAAFLLRAAGDTGAASGRGWLSWLSPLGWANAVDAFGVNKWWVLLLSIGLAVLLTVTALWLDLARDIGSGLLQPRAGRATAARSLRSPLALAWRMQRVSLFAWTALFVLMGYIVGSSAKSLASMLESSPQFKDLLVRLGGTGAVTDIYDSAVIGVLGLAAAGYAVQAILRLHAEEEAGRAEPILATAVSRSRWALSHVVIAFGGAALLLLAYGVAAGWSQNLETRTRWHSLTSLVGASLAQLPAVWLLAAIGLVLFGFVPKWSMGAWAIYAVVFIVGVIVPTAWPHSRVVELSPFWHIPKLPAAPMVWTPLIWLAALAVGATLLSLFGLQRRDMR